MSTGDSPRCGRSLYEPPGRTEGLTQRVENCGRRGRAFRRAALRVLQELSRNNFALLENSPARQGGVGCGDIPGTPPSRAGLLTNAKNGNLFLDESFGFTPWAFGRESL